MTSDQLMASRGLVEYDGKWRTRQHVELLEREKKLREATTDWSKRLELWRRWLTSRREDRAQQAHDEILAINDPLAAEPLVAMLDREDDYELKRLWIQVAARLDHPAAIEALVQLSLYDADESIRVECLELLIKSRRPGLVTPYIQALRSKDNEIINRAGAALGQIGDRDAIGPLVEALVTKHRVQVEPASSYQNAYSFSPNGGGGSYNFGSSGPKFETQSVKNPSVLSALVLLSGGTSFDYNQPQWRAWLAAQAKLNSVDVRRDE
jgi:HEAT repeats